jgi:CRP/FNR family transcriptional regulator, cyclic AMP receptor protein
MRRTFSKRPPMFWVDTGLGYRLGFARFGGLTPTCAGHRIVTRPRRSRTRGSVSVAAVDAAGIREITVFAELDDSQCECVARACRELEVEEGATLTEEGGFGYAMFAVVAGTADVFKNGTKIRSLGAGDVFGEIAVFFGGKRTATVVATSPMQLVMLFNGELARLDREVPEVADVLRKTVGERLAGA